MALQSKPLFLEESKDMGFEVLRINIDNFSRSAIPLGEHIMRISDDDVSVKISTPFPLTYGKKPEELMKLARKINELKGDSGEVVIVNAVCDKHYEEILLLATHTTGTYVTSYLEKGTDVEIYKPFIKARDGELASDFLTTNGELESETDSNSESEYEYEYDSDSEEITERSQNKAQPLKITNTNPRNFFSIYHDL